MCIFYYRGLEVAVIYGSLPPNTKLAQAAKFNDPNNSCKTMVATDAIGMGLNLYVEFYDISIFHYKCSLLNAFTGAYGESFFIQ